MKFEEVLPKYRDGHEVEYEGYQGIWLPMPQSGIDLFSVGFFMNNNFRFKPKKIKKYQIIYQLDGDPPDHFRMSNEHYTGQADFEENHPTIAHAHSCFSPSVKEFEK